MKAHPHLVRCVQCHGLFDKRPIISGPPWSLATSPITLMSRLESGVIEYTCNGCDSGNGNKANWKKRGGKTGNRFARISTKA